MKIPAAALAVVVALSAIPAQAQTSNPYEHSYAGGLSIVSPPVRILDTRDGSEPHVVLNQRAYWATAALVNIAIVNPDGPGFATVYPCGAIPDVSHVNWTGGPGTVESNMVPVAFDREFGEICVYTSTPADVVIDLVGWAEGNTWYEMP